MSVCEVDPELCQYSGHCWLLCFCVRGDLTSHYQPEYPQTPGSTSETKIQESPPPNTRNTTKGIPSIRRPKGYLTNQLTRLPFFATFLYVLAVWVSFLCLGTSFPKTDTNRHTHTHSQTHRRFAPIRCATVGRFEIAELKRDALAHAQPFLSV